MGALNIKNTGMAVAIDVGEANDIHPRNKQDVGKRLALLALNKTYGMDNIVPSGPLYKEMIVRGDKAVITFDHVGSGLMVGTKTGQAEPVESESGTLNYFSIQGQDRVWHKAHAEIKKNRVVVHHENVKIPRAVRYAYAMNPKGANLYNKDGLPASPFATDVRIKASHLNEHAPH
jgi:sialate O-acetylesterase